MEDDDDCDRNLAVNLGIMWRIWGYYSEQSNGR